VEKRYLHKSVTNDLKKKMVFISGPRQVGKTTLAKTLLKSKSGYLNWDIPEHRQSILKYNLPRCKQWCFDEIHKHKKWKDYLKGVYDKHGDEKEILVTGSARLDFFKKSGDSLQGRYYHLRLHPLSVAELKLKTQREFIQLLEKSGFPEPYFSKNKTQVRRWSLNYRSLLVNDEIPQLDMVSDIAKLELMTLRLPELVGAPLSINSLREDLEISHKTASRWLGLIEKVYGIFRLPPLGSSLIRAVKKEQKHYHYDWTLVKEDSFRFENLVACHLLKWVHYQRDVCGEDFELRYVRDTDKREVDFCLLKDQKPFEFVECKWSDNTKTSDHLKYFQKKFPTANFIQISSIGKKNYVTSSGIEHMPALKYLSNKI